LEAIQIEQRSFCACAEFARESSETKGSERRRMEDASLGEKGFHEEALAENFSIPLVPFGALGIVFFVSRVVFTSA
jgi:hypothetical protein